MNCRNEVIAIIHETFRNASVTRPPQLAAAVTRPIDCRPVGRPVTRGAQGEAPLKSFSPTMEKRVGHKFKIIGHSFKNFGPAQKTLHPIWCPKLVTGVPVCGCASGVKLYIQYISK